MIDAALVSIYRLSRAVINNVKIPLLLSLTNNYFKIETKRFFKYVYENSIVNFLIEESHHGRFFFRIIA